MSDQSNGGLPPKEWCERMRDQAKDGDTAYHYHQLAEQWKDKEKP